MTRGTGLRTGTATRDRLTRAALAVQQDGPRAGRLGACGARHGRLPSWPGRSSRTSEMSGPSLPGQASRRRYGRRRWRRTAAARRRVSRSTMPVISSSAITSIRNDGLDRAVVNLVPLLDHLDERLPLAVEGLVRGGGELGVDLGVGGHPHPEPVIGDQVVVTFLECGHHVEGDHLAGQVVHVLDAEVDPDGPPVGADPGGAVVHGERLAHRPQGSRADACRGRRCPAARS